MADILVVSDAPWVRDELRQSLERGGNTIRAVGSGPDVRTALLDEPADLVIADAQVGTMGGYAICQDILLESGVGRISPVPVLLLLDRRADVFLARRSGCAGWVLKPLDSVRLRRATKALLAGGRYEDETGAPLTVSADG